jgi:hypothetical protein
MASEVTTEDAGAGSSGGSRGVVVFGRRVPAGLWWALAELFALTGLAIAQPLLDVTGKAPDFFLLHRSDRTQILLLMALIVLAPAAGLWAGEALAWLLGGERARRLVHLVLVTGLFCVLALEVAKKLTPLRGRRLLLAALVVGVAAGLVYARWAAVRLWLRYLAPAPLVFALVFATLSPTAELILPSRSAADSPVPVQTRPGKPLPPVVMVLFDEFPLQSLLDSSGHIDRRVYPNFAGFADQATWYRNATGIGGWTPFAVPSMLSGTWPTTAQRGAVPDHSGWPNNLFTLLDRHYRLKVFETVTQLCPGRRCGQTGTRSGFATVARQTAKLYRTITSPADSGADAASVGENPDLAADTGKKGPTAYFGNLGQNQVRRVDQFVNSIDADDPQPTLYFLHVLLPHTPWKYLPDGRVYNSSSLPTTVTAQPASPAPVQQLNHQRHLVQLAFTDKVIARVLQRLKDQGLYDKSLVVMTADHGEGFTPGNGPRADQRPGRRPQLGARRPAAHHRRHGRAQHPLEGRRAQPDRPAKTAVHRQDLLQPPRPAPAPARAAQLRHRPARGDRHPGPGPPARRAGLLAVRPHGRLDLPATPTSRPHRRPPGQRQDPRLGAVPAPRPQGRRRPHPHRRPADRPGAPPVDHGGGGQRPGRGHLGAVPAPGRRAGEQLRHRGARLPLQGRARPTPAPAVPHHRRRDRSSAPARHHRRRDLTVAGVRAGRSARAGRTARR